MVNYSAWLEIVVGLSNTTELLEFTGVGSSLDKLQADWDVLSLLMDCRDIAYKADTI